MVRTRNGKTTRRESDVQAAPQPEVEEEEDEFDIELEESDDDDAPMEVSSKKPTAVGPDMMLVEQPEPEMSLFEQVQAKKKEVVDKKKEKTRERRLKRKRVQPGEFFVSEKAASFKVVTLGQGIRNPLVPAINFKAELLKARTADPDRRVKAPKASAHRAKWANKR